jgi:hypothetical protein
MNEATRGNGAAAVANRAEHHKKKNIGKRCSICNIRLRASAVPINEPDGVPEPRHSWILCRDCYQDVVAEVRRSPVRTPLRLRIAIGMVASERSPDSYSSTAHTVRDDYRKFIFIAMVFILAMLVHLALIVGIAFIIR